MRSAARKVAAEREDLAARVKRYAVADDRRAVVQVAGSLAVFFLAWYLGYRALESSVWITLLLTLPAGLALARIFILQHDLGHGALFRSKRVNDVVGSLFGVLTLVPFHYWRRLHNDHHSHSGDLDHRGPGCVTVLTVDEYLALSPFRRFEYRVHRNLFFTLVIGAPLYFLLLQRWPFDAAKTWRRERLSVHLTNLALVLLVLTLGRWMGASRLLMVHGPTLLISSSLVVWIFLNQHLFADTYWKRNPDWCFFRAGLEGSSYYRLPRALQWLTADVGFHHVHHLNPRIPNYNLGRCHDETPELSSVAPLSLRRSLEVARLALWDEKQERLIGFGDVRSSNQ